MLRIPTGQVVVLALSFLLAAPAAGSGPLIWVVAGAEQFSAGEHLGVSIGGGGDLELAPEAEVLLEAGVPRVWAVAAGQGGDVYVAAGEDGRVLRLRSGQERSTFFEVPERGIQSMAWGPDAHLYVASGPGGAVFRVPANHDGAPLEPWFVPGTAYVWDIAFDASGNVLLATGGDGKILRVDASGNGTELYDTPEPHVTALAIDGAGNVLAGTEGNSLVYRISPDGDVFVLFDAPAAEITDLLVVGDEVWASGFGKAAAEPVEPAGESAPTRVSVSSAGKAGSLSGAVYRIHPDGYVETTWTSSNEGVYSLAAFAGGIVAGTGGKGRLVQIRADNPGLLTSLDAAQVVAFDVSAAGELVAATSNVAKIYRLRDRFRPSGQYLSSVKDTGAASHWGTVRWRASRPEGTTVAVSTRSGNTGTPDDTWSNWSEAYDAPAGSPVTSPPARFLQWRVDLESGDAGVSPSLQRVEIAFVPRNLPPRITEFSVYPPGVVYRQNANFEDGLPFAQVPESVQRALREMGPVGGSAGPGAAGATGGGFLGRPLFIGGQQTLSWAASDPNGDDLSYHLHLRGEAEQGWKAVAGPLSETLFTLDTSRLADGAYVARLTAGDDASNPEGSELTQDRISRTFFVDNTGPVISGLRAEVSSSSVRVSGSVGDATSLIRQVRYSLDGGAWHTVRAADGVADSAAESIAFELEDLEPGEHTVVVSVADTALNEVAGKVVFVIR